MAYFNFKRLIDKYSKDFIAEIPAETYYDEMGEERKGTPKRYNLHGAIISHRESKVFRSEGTLSSQDRALYMLEPLENALRLAKIIYEGNVYSVGDSLDNSGFTGVWAYTLKYVSAFKETSPTYDITEELDRLEDRLDGILTEAEEKPAEPTITDSLEALEKRMSGGAR